MKRRLAVTFEGEYLMTQALKYKKDVTILDYGLTPDQEDRARELHENIIVFDSLMECGWYDEFIENCQHGGAAGGNYSIGITGLHNFLTGESCAKQDWWAWQTLVSDLEEFPDVVSRHADTTTQCCTAGDIRSAKQAGKIGLMLGTQNTLFMDRDLDRLGQAYELGLRIVQLTYNTTNLLGAGAMELEHSQFGLSLLGESAVGRLNDLGMLVDTGHSSAPTLMAAVEVSEKPIACTHAGVRSIVNQPRSQTDEALKKLADNGGVFGVVSTPVALNGQQNCSVNDYLDSIEYAINLMGVEHVGFGTDLVIAASLEQIMAAPEWGQEAVDRVGVTGVVWPWSDGHAGMENNAGYPNLTRGLIARGYSDDDIAKVMGGNWLRLIEETVG
jgi:membrane dipeptidase